MKQLMMNQYIVMTYIGDAVLESVDEDDATPANRWSVIEEVFTSKEQAVAWIKNQMIEGQYIIAQVHGHYDAKIGEAVILAWATDEDDDDDSDDDERPGRNPGSPVTDRVPRP